MNNSNPYDETLPWYPESRNLARPTDFSPIYDARRQQGQTGYMVHVADDPTQWGPRTASEKLNPHKTSRIQTRMPKAQAISLASKLKKTVIITSIAAFGLLSGLVAGHLQNTSTGQSTPSTQSTKPAPGASSQPPSYSAPSNTTNPSDSGGFFNQQGGGGYGFGNGGSVQAPATGSSVS